jgi:hypothetical protein
MGMDDRDLNDEENADASGIKTNRSERPEDFTFQFDYSEGSVPGESYYEYSIEVASDGSGEIHYLPDHPENNPDELVELFHINSEEMNRLYKVLKHSGMMHPTWQPSRTGRLGGPRSRLQVTGGGQAYDIRTFGDAGDKERVERLFELIRASVPVRIWDKIGQMKK